MQGFLTNSEYLARFPTGHSRSCSDQLQCSDLGDASATGGHYDQAAGAASISTAPAGNSFSDQPQCSHVSDACEKGGQCDSVAATSSEKDEQCGQLSVDVVAGTNSSAATPASEVVKVCVNAFRNLATCYGPDADLVQTMRRECPEAWQVYIGHGPR